MITKKFKLQLYQRAKDQGSFITLIPYPSLFFSWQNEAQKAEDTKTVKVMSAISCHLNGLSCSLTCKEPLSSLHKHHVLCNKNCEKIEAFIKKHLIRQATVALKRKLEAGQQILLDNH